jgi:HK97 family phage portal protein
VGLFLGRETRAIFPEPPIAPFPGADMGGFVNTSSKPDTALTVPTVWACVNLIAGAVSSLPLETFEKSADPASVPRRIADPQLLLTPDDGMTISEWLHMFMVSMLLRGNVYGLIRRDDMARVQSVHLLNPDAVRVEVDRDTGRISYKYTQSGRPINAQDMWHVRGLTLPGSAVGLSPISYAAAVLGLDLSSRQFASGFFDGGGIPKAVLESDQQVNQEQARTIKDRVMATFRGREPLVLGLGLKYTQIQVNPEESQFLATQQANVAQICRYFSVPAAMIDGPSGGGMQYTNTEQRGIEFLTYTLNRWLKRFEDAAYSLLPGPQYVRFNPATLLRLDAETQAKVDLQRIAGKIDAPSEIRARDGQDPMTEEQKTEVGMVPLGVGPLGRPVALPGLNPDPVPSTATPTAVNPPGA